MFNFSEESSYHVGWQEGHQVGLRDGYLEAMLEVDQRLAVYWAELATLNARVDYLEKHVGLGDRNE